MMGIFNLFKKKEDKRADMRSVIKSQNRRIKQLEHLCKEKDNYFLEMISDGLRHGSSLAGKHMADKKEYDKSRKKK